MPELLEEVTRAKAETADLERRRKQIHAKRSFRRWTDSDGAFRGHLFGNPEDGAGLWRVLDPIRRRLVVLRREAGFRESLDALDYDAMMAFASIASGREGELGLQDLVELGLFPQLQDTVSRDEQSSAISAIEAQNGNGGTSAAPINAGGESSSPADSSGRRRRTRRGPKVAFSPARVMVRVDLDTLLRGAPSDGELCEIVGYGPVSVSVIEDLVANDNAFVVGVLTRARQVVGIYHHRRHPNSHQKSALDFIYPTCAVRGCSARSGLQSDHREEWSKTHFTVFDLLDRLCPHHHRLKTHDGWALVDGVGKRDFVPPEDPRHPRHSGRKTSPRASASRSPVRNVRVRSNEKPHQTGSVSGAVCDQPP
jgi:hypothetical protein